MNVTITTDASFSKTHNRGTYAFFISSNMGRMSKSGILRKKCNSPSEAEMKCILNALTFLAQQKDIFEKCKNIYVNTDSMDSIHLLQGDMKAINKYRLRPLMDKMLIPRREVLRLFKNKKIDFRHVKGHNDSSTENRSRANVMCDNAARIEMGILIKKLEK